MVKPLTPGSRRNERVLQPATVEQQPRLQAAREKLRTCTPKTDALDKPEAGAQPNATLMPAVKQSTLGKLFASFDLGSKAPSTGASDPIVQLRQHSVDALVGKSIADQATLGSHSSQELVWLLRKHGEADAAKGLEAQLEASLRAAEVETATPIVRGDAMMGVDPRERFEVRFTNGLSAFAKVRPLDWDNKWTLLRLDPVLATNVFAEELAYRIDRILDLNFVPVTVLRKVDGKLCSVTEKVGFNRYAKLDATKEALSMLFNGLIAEMDGISNRGGAQSSLLPGQPIGLDHAMSLQGLLSTTSTHFYIYDKQHYERVLADAEKAPDFDASAIRAFTKNLRDELTPTRLLGLMTPRFLGFPFHEILKRRRDMLEVLQARGYGS